MKTMEQKLNEGRQYRNLTLQVRAKQEGEEESYIIEGYATTFNQPYELYRYKDWDGKEIIINEQVDSDAFKDSDMADTILQYDHQGKVYARVSNDTLKLTPDEHGLKVEAYLGGTEIGRQLYEEVNGGYITKMSFGFTIAEQRKEETEDDDKVNVLRTITKIGKLYDVSVVSIPANDTTEVSARSFVDGVIEEVKKEFLTKREIDILKEKIIMKGKN